MMILSSLVSGENHLCDLRAISYAIFSKRSSLDADDNTFIHTRGLGIKNQTDLATKAYWKLLHVFEKYLPEKE